MASYRPNTWVLLSSLFGAALTGAPSAAHACGGFFCGQQPVDQTAERILFEVGQDSVTMTTQISYNGKAEDFAWVLPLSEVPAVESLAVFPQRALNALDANSGPLFMLPNDGECYNYLPVAAPTAGAVDEATPPTVNVYIRAEVGDYEVAVIGSEDPNALVQWLRDEDYRITTAMEPYIARYTEEGLKFLALKLKEAADVTDIRPFRFTLPGTSPSIPLRMTAIAAEPEMSIVAFVLGERRYEGKNWPNLEIADDQIRFNPFSFSFNVSTNWSKLVAQAVDTAGGQGWVTEYAGPSASYAELVRQQVQNGNFATEDDREAAEALLGVLEAHPYLTRLYTRLSPEEMTSDPVLGQSALGDVAREHQLSRFVDGIDQCSEEVRISTDPCDFATCGAAGLCRPVTVGATAGGMSAEQTLPGCACLPGATARAIAAPDGSPQVICQDGRLSFLNPGESEVEGGPVLPDPCAGFSCGDNGRCVSMNMTPTCVCDQGFVAIGSVGSDGTRTTTCAEPREAVPVAFYAQQMAELPPELPGGREVTITAPVPMPEPGQPDVSEPDPAGFPMPRTNPALGGGEAPAPSASSSDGGCDLGGGASSSTRRTSAASLAALLGLALGAGARRRSRHAAKQR